MNEKAIIKNEILVLMPLDQSMYFDVWQNSLDEDNRRFVPDEIFETLEDATDAVNYLMSCYDNENGPYVYAVIRKADNKNLGYVQLVMIEEGWEIGYHIAKRYTGNGYATSAVKLFLEYLKRDTNIKEVYGVALVDNIASRKVLNKCGFELYFEGEGMYQCAIRKIIKSVLKIK